MLAPRWFTDQDFRRALGHFPTGVAIVTSRGRDGHKLGVTVNSFTSVSLEPPLVSFNLSNRLRGIADWLQAETFAINLLRDNQDAISSGFARAQTDKWSCTQSVEGITSNPVLTPNLAVFECRKFACHPAGDHVIMIGEVVHFNVGCEAEPLVFYRGNYRRIGEPIQPS